MKKPRSVVPLADRVELRLFVAGNSPHSTRALANVRALCTRYAVDRYALEVVDVLREPLRALEEGVFVTPTLVRLAPGPVQKLVGDLSEEVAVLDALGLSLPGGDA